MEVKELIVKAGNHNRENCPVSAVLELPPDVEVGLKDKESRKIVPFQVQREGQKVTLSWILDNLKAGEEKVYQLIREGAWSESPKGVKLVDVPGERMEVLIDDQLFTAYHYSQKWARPFLYPLIGPGGKSVTRRLATKEDKDMDHHHHRSFWVAHGDVNGVDNWSEEEGHGKTIHRSFEAVEEGPVFGRICARGDWVSSEGEKVLEEIRDIKIYNTPPSHRIIDLYLVLKATEGDVVFGDTKEGGVASLRVETSMEVRNGGKIENSYGGINEQETWGRRAHWCDYSGPVAGKVVGLALFDHPSSFRHPTYWHVRDYGLMTANPFAISHFTNDPQRRGDYTLRAGEKMEFFFRLYIHEGDAAKGKVAERYHDYVNPPIVEFK